MDFKIVEYEGLLVTESRRLAEVVEKQHKDLLRDIRNYIKVLDPSANLRTADYFIEAEYIDGNNQMRPCYLVTELGCSLVAQKMTGEKGILFSATYAAKFKEMEEQLKNQFALPTTYKEALVQLLEQVEINEQITQQLEVVQPKAEYFDTMIQNTNLLTMKEIALDYGMSAQSMNELLHELKIQYKSGKIWLLYSQYHDKGYVHSNSGINNGHTYSHTKWTQEGKKFIYDTLKRENIYPKIESVEYQLQTN